MGEPEASALLSASPSVEDGLSVMHSAMKSVDAFSSELASVTGEPKKDDPVLSQAMSDIEALVPGLSKKEPKKEKKKQSKSKTEIKKKKKKTTAAAPSVKFSSTVQVYVVPSDDDDSDSSSSSDDDDDDVENGAEPKKLYESDESDDSEDEAEEEEKEDDTKKRDALNATFYVSVAVVYSTSDEDEDPHHILMMPIEEDYNVASFVRSVVDANSTPEQAALAAIKKSMGWFLDKQLPTDPKALVDLGWSTTLSKHGHVVEHVFILRLNQDKTKESEELQLEMERAITHADAEGFVKRLIPVLATVIPCDVEPSAMNADGSTPDRIGLFYVDNMSLYFTQLGDRGYVAFDDEDAEFDSDVDMNYLESGERYDRAGSQYLCDDSDVIIDAVTMKCIRHITDEVSLDYSHPLANVLRHKKTTITLFSA
jgi:hypothetical protein